ncbi:addiction module antidote transcriptional regulator, HigA family [Psychroflexus torquis ATCC 700755]|uniref:Addiction module antidote transcriptional regulator, HigA family n=1 Tax=Psychroflexus torquis (strain ATCC 700755 / CIP 106069 / ACAM 623) TaxID=313595 RepID=K4IGF8_PSYTT|nr:HigA family addiction module antitoxin [Psychroflexus torquis]AFU68151.1 addiction module antidote transcriptional regulator, HigA family [Psychroflexus torquis ATCC 700755]
METNKVLTPVQATHPGVLIKDELDAIPDLNQRILAKELDVQPSFLNEIIKGKRPVTADIAILLEKILGISADYWMKFQSQYEIDKARVKQKNIKKVRNIELWSIIKEYVPVRYFKKHKYLNDDIESDIKTIKNIYEVETIDSLVTSFSKDKFAYYRKSDKLKIDEKNMFAWSSLAQYEAKNQKTNTFNFDNLNQLCINLNNIFYENSGTPEKVKAVLNQFGIKMLLIDKLEKTPIDGFSFWSEKNPSIALTLRYNRIDNFAFTILHEIGHIDLHLRNDKDRKFMDLTRKQNLDKCETEADNYAQQKLISKDIWQDILDNHLPLNDEKIKALGDKHKINPAILLGRVCYEMDYYAMKTTIDKKMK